ncbi:MAG: site-2 protease family protein [Myxococcota bacterium]
MDLNVLATLPVWLVIFLFSTTCHEAAHALAAKLGGDSTAHDGGQVTLDPTPHIKRHPLGMILAPIATFLLNGGGWMIGWASAPYDPVWANRFPRRAAWMAAAGPLANLILVLISGAIIMGGVAAGWFQAPMSPSAEHLVDLAGGGGEGQLGILVLSVVFTLNLLLFTFNLLPVPPLDGSAAIALLLPEDWFRTFRELFEQPGVAIIGLMAAWMAFGQLWQPVFLGALGVLFPNVTYSS